MSALNGPSPFGSNNAEDGESTGDAHGSLIRRLLSSRPPKAIQLAAFWVAVALPFLYLPLLITGVQTPGERSALAAMLAVNVMALYVGHDYRQPE